MPTIDAATARPFAALRASALTVVIDGRTVLHPLDLRIEPGTLTVVAGPNGAGKTTLLEALAGVRALRGGRVDGPERVAFVPQRSALPDAVPLTVMQLVRMGAWRRPFGLPHPDERADAARAMDALQITDLAHRPVSALSGGQRQRALLAQALARRADLLLLDEPTTGLDAESCRHILAAIHAERRRGAVVVCVSHDPVLIAAAGRILTLDAGRLV